MHYNAGTKACNFTDMLYSDMLIHVMRDFIGYALFYFLKKYGLSRYRLLPSCRHQATRPRAERPAATPAVPHAATAPPGLLE